MGSSCSRDIVWLDRWLVAIGQAARGRVGGNHSQGEDAVAHNVQAHLLGKSIAEGRGSGCGCLLFKSKRRWIGHGRSGAAQRRGGAGVRVREHCVGLVQQGIFVAQACIGRRRVLTAAQLGEQPAPHGAALVVVILAVLVGFLQKQDADGKAADDNGGADQVRKQVRIGVENGALEPGW